MKKSVLRDLRSIFGSEQVIVDERELSNHSLDLSPGNLLIREGAFPTAAVVVRPHGSEYVIQLKRLIDVALSQSPELALIPRGGGSGVCGASNARGGEVVVDTTLLKGVRVANENGKPILELQAGATGEDVDLALRNHSQSLEHGHYPASYNISTFGGWVQSASSGQYSSEFGTMGDIVSRIGGINGLGEPLSLSGRNRNQILGMEGTSCILTNGVMPLRETLPHQAFLTYRFRDVEDTASFLRDLHESRSVLNRIGTSVYAVRGYDWFDRSFVAKPHKGKSSSTDSSKRLQYAAEYWLTNHSRTVYGAIRLLEGVSAASWLCLVYVRGQSERALTRAGVIIGSRAAQNGGSAGDHEICRTWHGNRFKLSYEKLVARYESGILADTFECSPTWETVSDTYERVRRELSHVGVVGAHMGMDLTGPYLYFTFALPHPSKEAHDNAWTSALSACISSGARTNHHHGIGTRKAGKHRELAHLANGLQWYERARETKAKMDPHRILNPNNLV